MPTYKISFKLIHREGERVFREEKMKDEMVMAKNKSFAQLYLFRKYNIDKKREAIITDMEIITNNPLDYQLN